MALEGGERSASRPGRSLPPGKTRYPLYRRLGGPQGRLDRCGKSHPPPTRIQSLDRPACGQSLYRLRYPAHQEQHGFWKTLLKIQNVLWYCLPLLSGIFLILRIIQQDYHKSTQIFIRSQILIKPEYSWDFFKNTQTSNFLKIHSVGAESFRAERDIGTVRPIVAFHNFADTPQKLHMEVVLKFFTPNQIQGTHMKIWITVM